MLNKRNNVVYLQDKIRRESVVTTKYPVIKEKGALKEIAEELRAVPEEYEEFYDIPFVLTLAKAYEEASELPGIVTDHTVANLFLKYVNLSHIQESKIKKRNCFR